MNFTVSVTNASSGGTAGCPLTDTAILVTNTTGTQVQAPAAVTLCYQTQFLNSCLPDEAVLQAVLYPNGVLDGNGQKSAFLQDLLNRINQVRASASVPPLARVVPLETAAQGYSQTLIGIAPTSLSDTLNGDPMSRAVSAGYDSSATIRENLAAGQWSAQEVITAWTSSPEQYANLINPNFTQVGLGLAGGASGSDTFVLYWVADFGGSTQSFPAAAGGTGIPLDVRGVVAQLHTYLQTADAALCAGDTGAVDAELGQGGFADYWIRTGLSFDSSSLSENVGVCLTGVLGFYAASNGANYSSIGYIQATLLN